MRPFIIICILLFSSISYADIQKKVFEYQNFNREYYIYTPTHFKKGILFLLHGGGGKKKGKDLGRFTKMNSVAEKYGFYVVYPNSLESQWNDGRNVSENGADDIGFLNNLATKLSKKLNVHPKNIFVAGISNGGMMSARLACESDTFYGFAMVASNLPIQQMKTCKSIVNKPLIVINGTVDPIMPWKGGKIKKSKKRGAGGVVLSSEKTFQFFAKKNSCSQYFETNTLPDTNKKDSSIAQRRVYTSCKKTTVAYIIKGGGHCWPGSKAGFFYDHFAGPTNKDFSASEEIWKIFAENLM